MKKSIGFAWAFGALGMFGVIVGAQAGPIVYDDFGPTSVADQYWGGNNNYNGNTAYGDILANDATPPANLEPNSKFSIFGMDISKTGYDLIVDVNTNFAAGIGLNNINSSALNTLMGALFIGNGTPAYNASGTGLTYLLDNGVGGPQYDLDTFVGNPSRFDYAFVPSLLGPGESATTAQSADLKPLNGTGTDVQLSFGSGIIRTQQAVGYSGNAASVGGGEWQVVNSGATIRFTIDDFFKLPLFADFLQTNLTLAWAMSCANDVAYATVNLTGRAISDVPLPAGLVLLLSGLFGLGFLGRFKAKSLGSTA